MIYVCDRCGCVCTLTGWQAINRDGRTLVLCRVHRRDHEVALIKQGWTLLELCHIETEPSKSGEPDALHAPE